jgi:hypothetical protein
MTGLRFSFLETFLELESAFKLTRDFTNNGDYIFSQLKAQLENLQYGSGPATQAWEIPRNRPLRIKDSCGGCEIGGGGMSVSADFSFVWHAKRIPLPQKKKPAKEFHLNGKASAIARVFQLRDNGSRGEEIAMWRVEIGDDNSPGCHFHVQIMGEVEDGAFPSWLPIPRLPTCLTSPMAALEFLLAELFQDSWKNHLRFETDELKRWRTIQRGRLSSLLAWQSETVADVKQASPWSILKSSKPPSDLFVT